MSTKYRIILRDIINEYYAQFKTQTRKCLWVSAFVPSEILKSFDVDIFYPESYAAVLSIRKISIDLLSKADSLGFSENICSYMRLFFGALNYDEKLPFGNIPKPDAFLVSNNQCGTLLLSWKLLSKDFKVPLFIIDFPPNNGQEGIEEYASEQLKNLVNFIKSVVKSDIDMDKLKLNIQRSSRVSELWAKLCDRVFTEELSISIQILTNNFFFPIVSAHSNKKTVKFLEAVNEQLPKKEPTDSENYKKIYWWGYPFWFTNDKFPKLSKYGSKIVANNYLRWWCIPINQTSNPLEDLANSYSGTYLNRNIQEKISDFKNDFHRYAIDGVIVHINSSCKRDSVISNKIVDILKNEGIPTVAIYGDMCDKNKFQPSKALLNIEAFLENV